MFGGVEMLMFNVKFGMRMWLVYSVNLIVLVMSNLNIIILFEGLVLVVEKLWVLYEEVIKGGVLCFLWLNKI